MQEPEGADDGRTVLSRRTAEVIVALLLLAGAATVIFDSMRIGYHWREGEGPAPGYFPFYIAVILAAASVINLFSALGGRGSGEIFVSARPFGRVLAVLIPSIGFVALIMYIGIYAASAVFIMFFMIFVGRENPLKALGIAVFVPVALFFMFEKWFLVPLPKGPLEAWLGY